MPPQPKIKLIPEDIRDWLEAELKERGFSGYVALTADLNEMLEQRGLSMTIGKSAVHEFGVEYEQFARAEKEAGAWAVSWMEDNGLEEEAKRHNVLFQMITTLAFKVMKSQMVKDGGDIDPQQLHFIGRLMKDVMTSSGIREKLSADQEKQIAARATLEAKEAAATSVSNSAKQLGLSNDTIEAIKAEILAVRK